MSNLPTNPINNTENTQGYFSGYYETPYSISGDQYDSILTFFLRRTQGNRPAAEALASSILAIAQSRGLNPMSIIQEFDVIKDEQGFKSTLISFINSNRRPTSKLGFVVAPSVNQYVERNIGK